MELVQLCYVSCIDLTDLRLVAQFKSMMLRTKQFFIENNIHGVSFYANEYFLHCFEGDKKEIEIIYQYISQHNHQNYRFCFLHKINNFHFQTWQIKYVDQKSLVQLYCRKKGLHHFTPMHLTDQEIKELMDIICLQNKMYA